MKVTDVSDLITWLQNHPHDHRSENLLLRFSLLVREAQRLKDNAETNVIPLKKKQRS